MIGRVLAGRYELNEVIGQGGMAVLYRASDGTLGRDVAVKVLRDQYADDPEFVERFEREARAAARLAHPNIVDIYDVGSDGSTHYIVMELVDGDSLKSLVRRGGPLPPALVIRFGREIAAALDYAHRHGLVHRDVKPQNVLIDADGHAKLTDFGIARAAEAVSLTQTGTVLGTAQYMAPEQARGRAVTPATDVYSMGVVLYELATGRLPFEGESPLAVALRHVQDEPTPPRQLNPSLPRALESVILRAMAKEPTDRYASAAELGEALERPPDPIQEPTVRAPVSPGSSAARQGSGAGLAAGATTVARRPVDGRPRTAVGRRPFAAAPRRRPLTAERVVLLLLLLASLGLLALGFNWLMGAGRQAPQPTPTPTPQPAVVNPTATRPAPTATPVPATATPVPPTATPVPTRVPPTATPAPTRPPATATPAPKPAPKPTAPAGSPVAVPNVMGMNESDARKALEDAGFRAVVEEISRGPKGVVNDQSPEPGFRLPQGSQVKIAIGS